jgi:hypothetical protein
MSRGLPAAELFAALVRETQSIVRLASSSTAASA